jgi:hypothetical protein
LPENNNPNSNNRQGEVLKQQLEEQRRVTRLIPNTQAFTPRVKKRP